MSTAARPLMLRLLSASTCAANRAGAIIRDVLKSGKLGVVEKVDHFDLGSAWAYGLHAVTRVNMIPCSRVMMTHRLRQTEEHSNASWLH